LVETANVFETKSTKLELQPGEYAWCACGKSKNQPWCDGSHTGGAFSPVKFTVSEAMTKSICLCKQSKNPPFCDGSHKPLREAAMAAANAAAAKMAAERAQSAGPTA
jgi:CDGSH-type Zn-finger protein